MQKIKVLTSQYYANEIGTIKEVSKNRIVVKFDNGEVGFYDISKNQFEIIDGD